MNFAPIFRPQIETLLKYESLHCQIDQPASGSKQSLNSGNDRFSLRLSCGGAFTNWNVILDQQNPQQPPDFIFGDEVPPVKCFTLPSFRLWNVTDCNGLLRIVLELVEVFKEKLSADVFTYPNDRIQFECSLVRDIPGSQFSLTRTPNTEILISLPVDVPQQLLAILLGPNVVPDKPRLEVTYYPESDNKLPSPKVSFPSSLAPAFEGFSTKFPPWNSETCIIEYLPTVSAIIGKSLEALLFRREVIIQIHAIFRNQGIVEYDLNKWRYTSLMVSSGDILNLVTIKLASDFPASPPTIFLQSLPYVTAAGTPIAIQVDNVPWSPRWLPQEIAARIEGVLLEHVEDFTKACSKGAF